MTQAELAAAANNSTRNIQRYEGGDNEPKGVEFLRLLGALGVTIAPNPPEDVPGSVNAEIRALRDQLAKENVSMAFAPSLESLSPRERKIIEVCAGGVPEDPDAEFLGYLRSELHLDPDEARFAYEMAMTKLRADPENERRMADAYEEALVAAVAGGQPDFGPAPDFVEPGRLEALRESVAEAVAILKDEVLVDLADVRTRLERLEAVRSQEQDPPTDQENTGS